MIDTLEREGRRNHRPLHPPPPHNWIAARPRPAEEVLTFSIGSSPYCGKEDSKRFFHCCESPLRLRPLEGEQPRCAAGTCRLVDFPSPNRRGDFSFGPPTAPEHCLSACVARRRRLARNSLWMARWGGRRGERVLPWTKPSTPRRKCLRVWQQRGAQMNPCGAHVHGNRWR